MDDNDNDKQFAKNEKELKTSSENIQSVNRNGIWHRKMHHASNEKQQKTPDGRNGTTKSRKIRTLREKEIYNYSGILEADTIKQVERKEKIKKELIKGINTWAVSS